MPRRGLRHRPRMRLWQRILLILLVFLAVIGACFARCRPVVEQYAKSHAVRLAETTANETVAQVLQAHTAACRSLIAVSYNSDNILSDVRVDAATVNTVKTAASAAVTDAFAGISTLTVDIPLGAMLGLTWISGLGPRVSVPLSMTNSVFTTVTSSLEDVGMNQASYRVNIHVKIHLWVVTPAEYAEVVVETDFPMAEAVLLGEVPENFTQVYGDSQDTIGEIFDYGTLND